MIILFYISGFLSIIFTVCVIFNKNPIHALFCLVLSLLSVSCTLFVLGAPFAGALEIIIYAGAILVLFVFTIMMFDMKKISSNFDNNEYTFLSFKMCCGILLLMSSLLIVFLYNIFELKNCFINIFIPSVSLKKIGIKLFGEYVLVVEMASFLLLSSLISVLHIVQSYKISSNFSLKRSKVVYKL